LRLWVGFWVMRAWHHLPPLMALEQPIDGTVINAVTDMLFKREMNQLDSHNVALCGTFQKWREKGGFFVLGAAVHQRITMPAEQLSAGIVISLKNFSRSSVA